MQYSVVKAGPRGSLGPRSLVPGSTVYTYPLRTLGKIKILKLPPNIIMLYFSLYNTVCMLSLSFCKLNMHWL